MWTMGEYQGASDDILKTRGYEHEKIEDINSSDKDFLK